MNDLTLNQTFQATGAPFSNGDLLRLLWFDAAGNAVMIPMEQTYARRQRPLFLRAIDIRQWIADGVLRSVEVRPDPYSLLDDDTLTRMLLARPGKPKRDLAYPVAFRKKWRDILLPIAAHAAEYWAGHAKLRALVLRHRPEGCRAGLQSIYLELYRFWANGSDPLAILPMTRVCGEKGKPRAGTGRTLGRKKVARNLASQPNANYPLTGDELSTIQHAWRQFVGPDVPVPAAYRKFLNTYYVRCIERIGGRLQIRLQEHLPSLEQFRYHGAKAGQEHSAFRLRLIGNTHALNYRALNGRADLKTYETGRVGILDASSNDTNLCSIYDPLLELGPARILPLVESTTGYIAGFSLCWNVNEEAANLAILNAATSKVSFCQRYGYQITDEDWFPMQFAEVIGDHGELHNIASRERSKATRSQLSILPVGRADLKGTGEYIHSVLHDHDLPASTGGRIRDRGDPRRNEAPLLNSFDIVRMTIRRILVHNNEQIVEHLLTVEMKQDNVKPTRKEILKWSMAKGYHYQQHIAKDKMIAARCPRTEAVVKRDGVYLMARRHGAEGDLITLPDHRYLGEWIEKKGWLETARRSGNWRITVCYNPNDLSEICYADLDDGLQYLTLATTDPLLAERVTWMDAVKDAALSVDRLRLEHRGQIEAQAADDAEREADVQNARDRRREAEEIRGKPGRSTATGRRANRTQEVRLGGNVPVHLVHEGEEAPASLPVPESPPPDIASKTHPQGRDEVADEIEKFLQLGEDSPP